MKQMRKLQHIAWCALAYALAVPAFVYAIDNPLRDNLSSVAGFVEALLRAALFILFPIAVVFIVYSGFLFITAQGNGEKLTQAKNNFFWTIIGVALLLGAWALAMLIQSTIDPILRT